MNLLSRVESGVIPQPLFAVIFGEPGCGKSTFGSQFPDAFFVDIERGSRQLNIPRFIPVDLNEVIQISKELLNSKYETIVYDSMDALEAMLWKQICLENGWFSIEDPGYGKGYVVALKKWEELMALWEKLRQSKNVILVCHTEVKTVSDPTQLNPYDKFQIKLNKHPAALIRSRTDMILFAQKEQILKTEKNSKKAKVVGEERLLYTSGGPGFEGKNRYRMPEKLPLSFADFWEAYRRGVSESADQIVAQIESLYPRIEESKLKAIKDFVEKNKNKTDQLLLGLNRAKVLAKPEAEDE